MQQNWKVSLIRYVKIKRALQDRLGPVGLEVIHLYYFSDKHLGEEGGWFSGRKMEYV